MRHPSEASLSLYAGGELGLWTRFNIARHVRGCDRCSRHVEEFRALRDWTLGQAGALPPGVNWNALATEMKANIRVGLAAGECVADEPAPMASRTWRMPALVLPVLLVVIAGWLLQTLPQPVPRVEQAQVASDEVVLEGAGNGIGLQAEGRGFTLLTPRTEKVMYTVRGQGAIRARYVDADTGQVTISHVYAQ